MTNPIKKLMASMEMTTAIKPLLIGPMAIGKAPHDGSLFHFWVIFWELRSKDCV